MSDIAELFARDPQQLTDMDLDKIIEEMRKKRHIFKTVGATAAAKPVKEPLVKIDLGSLNL